MSTNQKHDHFENGLNAKFDYEKGLVLCNGCGGAIEQDEFNKFVQQQKENKPTTDNQELNTEILEALADESMNGVDYTVMSNAKFRPHTSDKECRDFMAKFNKFFEEINGGYYIEQLNVKVTIDEANN